VSSMALLACVGVDEEGSLGKWEVFLAVEVAGTQKGAAYASLLRGLIDRGLKAVELVISDDHERIKAAVFKVRRQKTAQALVGEFVELYAKRFPKAVSVFEAGIGDALSYLSYREATTPGYAPLTYWSGSLRR
jgi:transposase-like protein